MKVVGIDPGMTGGFAYIEDDEECRAHVLPMLQEPTRHLDTFRLLKWLKGLQPDFVAVEDLLYFRGSSPLTQITSAINWGRIMGACECLSLPVKLINPKRWQEVIEVTKGPSSTTKHRAYLRMKQLYPSFNPVLDGCKKPHDGIVDAILIAKAAMIIEKRKR